MNTDIRISVSFRNHRKRKRLKMILGPGSTDYLLDLWIATAMNRPSGVLHDMDEVDIAFDAGWEGDPKEFVGALVKCGLMDFDGSTYSMHDWEDHQGYVVHADVRKERARKAASKRWESKDNAESVPQACSEHADSMPQACDQHDNGYAPSPAPIPIPNPNPKPAPLAHTQDAHARVDNPTADSKSPLPPGPAPSEYSSEFLQLAEQYPRKDEGLAAAWIAFKGAKAAHTYPGNPIVLPILVAWRVSPQWTDDGGRFVPAFSRWIRERRWEAGPPEDEVAKVAKQVADMRAVAESKKVRVRQ
jgi:hypothetical protein